jgi:hypothetical protein
LILPETFGFASGIVDQVDKPDLEVRVKSRRPKKANSGMVLGVAWYREADWPRIKALFPDAKELHDSYAEWLKSAEDSVKWLGRPGVSVEPITIDIDDFLGWCTVRGRTRDAAARSEYVIEKLGLNYPS